MLLMIILCVPVFCEQKRLLSYFVYQPATVEFADPDKSDNESSLNDRSAHARTMISNLE